MPRGLGISDCDTLYGVQLTRPGAISRPNHNPTKLCFSNLVCDLAYLASLSCRAYLLPLLADLVFDL